MVNLGESLGKLLGPLLKTITLPLIRNVLKLFAKSVSVPLGLTAAATATDAAIEKEFFELGMTALTFSNDDLNNIKKVIKSLEDSALLKKGVTETIKVKQINNKADFLACY